MTPTRYVSYHCVEIYTYASVLPTYKELFCNALNTYNGPTAS